MESTRNDFGYKGTINKMFMVVIVVALSSQIYIDLSISNFKISFAIIIFGIFMFSFDELNPTITGAFTSLAVYVLRVVIHMLKGGNGLDGLFFYFPEIFFYFLYAVFLHVIMKKISKDKLFKLFFYLILCDYLANFVEAIIREYNVIHLFYDYNLKLSLLLVAIIRAMILWLGLNFIKYYRMLLMKEEHEIRYRKLLLTTAKLKTETYWMKKTMGNLEAAMSEAYELFEKITLNKDKDTWASRAVNIAKDVHEIKKEYAIVVRGVEEATNYKEQGKGMKFKDLINILDISMKNEIKYKNLNLNIKFKIESDFYTKKHYYLMSIFRNIIMNAIEALESKSAGSILFEQNKEERDYIFYIKDDGPGISKEDMEFIFSPGFSTKINYGTGEINRGLGLSIVKHMVEEKFKGKIKVDSTKEGTSFTIIIPKNSIEEDEE
ncbi:ATP-binding protein [Haloimpatiens sp. FM7315]|uniref:ATP-binding protein n=1 Tax=Haloimpatiens sp. FM7315 TaxID=3298609 RepID=UPI003709E9C9